MTKTPGNSDKKNGRRQLDLRKMQYAYLLGAGVLVPVSPFLYLQAQYTRWKVGRLPDAEGATRGKVGEGHDSVNLLAIGESTVAGIGAKTHNEALTGQFSKHLAAKTNTEIKWHALGESGITIRRTIDELLPLHPELAFDVVVVALGGNDVFKLNSPEGFRKDLGELLTKLRDRSPESKMFLANVPMVRDFIALPNPLRYVLSRLAKMHHFNAIDLVSGMSNVYYFDDVERVDDDFFSDGIHPSVKGYDQWSEAMVESFLRKSG